MPERRRYLAANWKMNKTIGEAGAFLDDFLAGDSGPSSLDVAICPSFVALKSVVERCRDGAVKVMAQTMHEGDSGAFTGEVSAAMLVDIGVRGVILGHSERRSLFGETDEALARKVPAALAAGLEPIFCVGESDAEQESGKTEDVLTRQVQTGLAEVDAGDLGRVVIAYEPVWAIGTGKTATPETAQDAIALIRGLVGARDERAAEDTRILYGGSVKPANAAELLAQPDIDGALVGGAALDPADFAGIVEAAAS